MDKNKKLILKEIKDFHNQLISLFEDVYLLVGFSENEEDYYYVLKDENNKYSYTSCVIDLTYLKDKICENNYNKLLKKYSLEEKMILKFKIK